MRPVDYSKERRIPFLRGAAQSLQESNRTLRTARTVVEARLAELEAGIELERAARAAAEAEAACQTVARTAAETEAACQAVARTAAEAEAACQTAARAAAEDEVALRRAERDEAERQRVDLLEQLAKAQAELASLRELLALREQQLYGTKTERRPAVEAKQKLPKKKKKRKGHGPTSQPDLPVIPVVHTLVGDQLACDHCGGTLEPMGTAAEEAELIALEDRKVVLEQHLRTKYQCPCCRKGVKVAPGPVKLIPGGRYALSFTIDVAYMKYMAHLPLERQAQLFRHDGLQVTVATLFDQIDELATALAPTYEAIWAVVQAEAVLCADETPWAVMSNGHTENERFYAWCAVGSQFVAYRLLDNRSAEGAATILGAFAGILMVDGLTSYPAAAKGAPGEALKFIVANCHAHARRKFVECEKYWPVESKYVIALYRKLYDIEREGKESGANLGALRQERSKPLIDELFTWAKEQQARPDVLPSSGLAKALAYLVNHEAGLRVFLDNPAVPVDNNAAERAMRAPVLGRKNFYGSRSRRATQVAAIFYTLVESAKRVGVSPKAYIEAAVVHALQKAGNVLLPDEFKRQLEAIRATPPPSTD